MRTLFNPAPGAGPIFLLGLAGALAYLGHRRRRQAAAEPEPGPSGPGRGPGDPEVPGSSPPQPGPSNEGPAPMPNGWGGGQYGPGSPPPGFNWVGNRIYISPDCQTIAESWRFLPIPGSQELLRWWMPANGGPSAQASLAAALGWITPGGTIIMNPRRNPQECGQRYWDEIVTVTGYTLDNPYGMFAIANDYVAWRNLAEKLYQRMDARWEQLVNIEETKTTMEFVDQNLASKNGIADALANLPGAEALIAGPNLVHAIQQTMDLAKQIQCFRERIDDKIMEYGQEPEATLPLPVIGTAWGYIARLVARRARDNQPIDAEEIALVVFEEAQKMQDGTPSCPHPFDVNAMKNHPALQQWWNGFVGRVASGIEAFEDAWYLWNPYWQIS